ncbi:MAG: B12-binding domain-containing protein [Rubrivivax sp.]
MSTDSDKRPRRPAASLLGDRSVAALERTLRAEVIPRLVRAHRHRLPEEAAPAAVQPGPGDADRFLLELLGDQPPAQYPTVQMLLSEGAELEALCLGLFGPVASRLGTLWRDDRCDFTTVTVAMGRLHRLMRELSAGFDTPRPRVSRPPRALLAQPADEQHLFGLAMVAEFMRRDGWDVLGGVGAAVPDAGARVRDEWVDLVGFSIGSDDRIDWLRENIRRVRAMSCNEYVQVVVGGPVFITHPQWAVEVGADGTALDASAAVELANDLVAARQRGEQEVSKE